MKISAVSFTENGDKLNAQLSKVFADEDYRGFGKTAGLIKRKKTLSEWTKHAFSEADALIFIGAVGIAVRSCAPYIKSKAEDPAVIVVDERGDNVIPILSGHIGGANALAERIAEFLGARAVITTATDINGVWAADAWAARNGYKIADISQIKYLSTALLRKEKIGFMSDFKTIGTPPAAIDNAAECGVVISAEDQKRPFKHTLNIIVPCVHIGVGAKRGADGSELIGLVKRLCEENGIAESAVAGIATIDIKRNEGAVLEAAEHFGCPLRLYTAAELAEVRGEFSESEFVKRTVGVGCVCERAAVLSSGGRLTVKKITGTGVTAAAAIEDVTIDFKRDT